MIKTRIVFALALILCPALVFGAGQTPQTGGAAAGAAVDNPGRFAIYNTLSDYERETGKSIGSFNEAPELAALVNEGKLPEAVEFFDKYLELAPDGQYAAQAKGIADQLK